MEVKLWLCPTRGCGNYYASSSSADRDLGAEKIVRSSMQHGVGETPGTVIGNRGICPDCKQRGEIVQREPLVIDVSPTGPQTLHRHKLRIVA
jgi:hypothetical protein